MFDYIIMYIYYLNSDFCGLVVVLSYRYHVISVVVLSYRYHITTERPRRDVLS